MNWNYKIKKTLKMRFVSVNCSKLSYNNHTYIPGQITLAIGSLLPQRVAFGSIEHWKISSSVPLQFKPLINEGI